MCALKKIEANFKVFQICLFVNLGVCGFNYSYYCNERLKSLNSFHKLF